MRMKKMICSMAVATMCMTGSVMAQDMGNDKPMPPAPGDHPMPPKPGDMKPMDGMPMKPAEADKMCHDLLTMLAQDPTGAGDKMFAFNALVGGMFEVKFSELVAAKVSDAKVKELAQMLIKDHSAAGEKLKPIAAKLGVMPPHDLPMEKQMLLKVMEKLPPADLEKAFLTMQKSIHAHDITMFSDEGQVGADPALVAFARETGPKLEAHGAMIVKVAQDKGIEGDLAKFDD